MLAKKYNLEINDSSKILTKRGTKFFLITPSDSLLINKFEIYYNAVSLNAPEYFKKNANQQVKNTLTPKVTEYYRFDKGNVLFVGYTTGNSLKPYTIFNPPLVISPAKILKKVKSSGKMETYNSQNNSFSEKHSTYLIIKNLGLMSIIDRANNDVTCILKEIILTRDAIVGYGQNNLILPDAVLFKTKLLVNSNGYPIAEWSVKLRNEREEDSKLYLELLKYQLLID